MRARFPFWICEQRTCTPQATRARVQKTRAPTQNLTSVPTHNPSTLRPRGRGARAGGARAAARPRRPGPGPGTADRSARVWALGCSAEKRALRSAVPWPGGERRAGRCRRRAAPRPPLASEAAARRRRLRFATNSQPGRTMSGFMAGAFDATDLLADYRRWLKPAAHEEPDLVAVARLWAARTARTACGTPCRVVPAGEPAQAAAGRKAPWRSTRHLAGPSSAGGDPLPGDGARRRGGPRLVAVVGAGGRRAQAVPAGARRRVGARAPRAARLQGPAEARRRTARAHARSRSLAHVACARASHLRLVCVRCFEQ